MGKRKIDGGGIVEEDGCEGGEEGRGMRVIYLTFSEDHPIPVVGPGHLDSWGSHVRNLAPVGGEKAAE